MTRVNIVAVGGTKVKVLDAGGQQIGPNYGYQHTATGPAITEALKDDGDVFIEMVQRYRVDVTGLGAVPREITDPILHSIVLDPGVAGQVSQMMISIDNGGRAEPHNIKALFGGNVIAEGDSTVLGTVFLSDIELMSIDLVVDYPDGDTFIFQDTVPIHSPD